MKLVEIERLHQELGSAVLHCFDDRGHVVECRHQDHVDVAGTLAHVAKQIDSGSSTALIFAAKACPWKSPDTRTRWWRGP